jgi:hypothetical protein
MGREIGQFGLGGSQLLVERGDLFAQMLGPLGGGRFPCGIRFRMDRWFTRDARTLWWYR